MNKKQFMIELENEIVAEIIAGTLTHGEIGEKFGVCEKTVYEIGKRRGLRRKRGMGSPAWKFKQARKQQVV